MVASVTNDSGTMTMLNSKGEEFEKGSGTQFDPRFAKIMLEIINEDVDYRLREN